MAPKFKDQLGSVGEWMGSLCYPSFSKGSNMALFWLFGLLDVFWPAGRLDRNVWLKFWVLFQEVALGPMRQSRHPLWRLLRIDVQGSDFLGVGWKSSGLFPFRERHFHPSIQKFWSSTPALGLQGWEELGDSVPGFHEVLCLGMGWASWSNPFSGLLCLP